MRRSHRSKPDSPAEVRTTSAEGHRWPCERTGPTRPIHARPGSQNSVLEAQDSKALRASKFVLVSAYVPSTGRTPRCTRRLRLGARIRICEKRHSVRERRFTTDEHHMSPPKGLYRGRDPGGSITARRTRRRMAWRKGSGRGVTAEIRRIREDAGIRRRRLCENG